MGRTAAAAVLLAILTHCGGGGSSPAPDAAEPPPSAPPAGCDGSCATANSRLTVADVQTVISRAAAEATAQNAPATIAVVDRVGNVLGVFRTTGAPTSVSITSQRATASGALENIDIIPSELAAIAKAITGAYLSSEGNAFTTRTAGQIVQEHFNPGEFGQPSGPLFGVQFSQLPCSDLVNRYQPGVVDFGPKRSPLGLSADPGGLPLYKDGVPVGGIGIAADPLYTFDAVLTDLDRNADELIAVAGAFGYAAPLDRRAERITVEGKTFRYSDVDADDLASSPESAAPFNAIDGVQGNVIEVFAYFDGTLVGGTAFGQPNSGVRSDSDDYPGLDAFVLVDENNTPRFRPRGGTDGSDALTEDEVRMLLSEALTLANRARAQIRRPASSQARVSISVVDTNGEILGIVRTRDAPIFGLDVSLQKARTAAFFSGAYAADDLRNRPDAVYLNADGSPSGEIVRIGSYVDAVQTFLAVPTALEDGAFAFADRSGGNLSRPYFPDGLTSAPPGPLSKPFAMWSPFNVGLQLDLVFNDLVMHLTAFLTADGDLDVPPACARPGVDDAGNPLGPNRLKNGIQIFPGSVPIYRGDRLVGGIGVSGDGVDQDDMISFLGLHNAGELLGTINNAPVAMRADQLSPMGTRLRYVQCPQAPFLDSDEQNVCDGK